MTKLKMYIPPIFEPFVDSTIGFDKMFERMAKLSADTVKSTVTYPPYNIKKLDENKYAIEIAVAGFGQQNLDIEMKDGLLTIFGKMESTDDDYLFKGIATRAFTRTFTLADTIEIQRADLINGVLKIVLENLIPESKKAKKININADDKFEAGEPELLNEEEKKYSDYVPDM